MSGIHLYTSNKMEVLLQSLAELVKIPSRYPMEPEVIVVQNRGTERWISMKLAEIHGIWAHCEYPFPNAFLHNIIKKVLGDIPEESPFNPELLAWKILQLFQSIPDSPEFEQVHLYLERQDPLGRYQFARKVADLFDQYSVFRQDMILEWGKGSESNWQAQLWRLITENKPALHRVELTIRLFEKISSDTLNAGLLPGRVNFFGISSLPPLHLEMLQALSRRTTINLFLLNPCLEYWDDIVSEREIGKIIHREGRKLASAASLHLERGNTLLASLGTYGRDFLSRIHDLEGEEHAFFVEPCGTSLLSMVQSDLLHMRNRGSPGIDSPEAISKNDRSIQVHSAHSKMREIEVLHDNLQECFQSLPGLELSDIVVMTPDIEEYASHIDAVFGNPEEKSKRLQYTIADRALRNKSRLVECFFIFLQLPGSRYTVPMLLSVLETQFVLDKFGIGEKDIARIQTWIEEVGIRWGIDEKTRSDLNLPDFRENTWMAGIERMLLGYALPGGDNEMFKGIHGFEKIEGAEIIVLGKFLDFATALFDITSKMSAGHTLKRWSELLTSLLEEFFFVPDDYLHELKALKLSVLRLSSISSLTGYEEKVDLKVITAFLQSQLGDNHSAPGFLSGGITFCSMLPMRSIPFRVVCIIGLNDGSFPRRLTRTTFDLIASKPRRGDRSLEFEDRYLFLEALLSARDIFYVSYVGQSARDNSLRRPSVVVGELLNYLERDFPVQSEYASLAVTSIGYESSSGNRVITLHRAQAYNSRYFSKGSLLFSYSKENFKAAHAFSKGPIPEGNFFPGPLAPPPEEYKTIDIQSLVSFLNNPVKFLVGERIGIRFERSEDPVEESEPFSFNALERYSVHQQLLDMIRNGGTKEHCFGVLRGSGKLPHGMIGQISYDQLIDETLKFNSVLDPFMRQEKKSPVSFSHKIGDFQLTGILNNLWQEHQIHYKFGKLKPKDRLEIWLYHLTLNILNDNSLPSSSVLIAQDGVLTLQKLEGSRAILEDIIGVYWTGLREPSHFFVNSSWAYAESLLCRNNDVDAALRDASKEWFGNDYTFSAENRDPYYELCFRNENPLNTDFERLSQVIWEPFLKALEPGT